MCRIVVCFLISCFCCNTLLGSPQWMLDQIAQDLAPFQNGIDEETLDLIMAEAYPNKGFIRVKIIDGDISTITHSERANQTQRISKWLNNLQKKRSLPDVDFIISMHDSHSSFEPLNDKIDPVFYFSKNKNQLGDILIPDHYALNGYSSLTKQIQKGMKAWPWGAKIEIAFWRGSTTGGDYNLIDWKKMPRTQLVMLSRENPLVVDARFTGFCQGADKNPEMLENTWLLAKKVSEADSLQYKYLVDIDGNTCGWNRLYWTLLSNSVVFKQQSDNIEWYYGILTPYKHFIPIAHDCNDLIDQVAWAKSHDDECRKIAEEATRFALKNLNEDAIYEYFYLVLLKYAELLNFQPHK